MEKEQQQRPYKINKPVVLLSARVHPGQSPSSYSIQGAIRFLLSQTDLRAYILRRNFNFIIIPMLNPDGVSNGMFRNDLYGYNLNRVYLSCEKQKHVTIWSFRQYVIWLSKNKNVLFYFDFHAHPSTKNFFIYGNSFSQIAHQTEAEIFGKMIQANCPYFQNFDSIFTQRQMKVKQKNDIYSKQGCARVYMHKLFNIIHSYTVECGYFGASKINLIEDKAIGEQGQNNKQKLYKTINGEQYKQEKDFQVIDQQYSKSYTPQSYKLMGKSILVTILDLFGMNPYPKCIKNTYSSTSQLRKLYGSRIYYEIDKFRRTDASCSKKLSDLSSIIEQLYYNDKLKYTNLLLESNVNNKLLDNEIKYMNSSPRSKKIIMINSNSYVNGNGNSFGNGNNNGHGNNNGNSNGHGHGKGISVKIMKKSQSVDKLNNNMKDKNNISKSKNKSIIKSLKSQEISVIKVKGKQKQKQQQRQKKFLSFTPKLQQQQYSCNQSKQKQFYQNHHNHKKNRQKLRNSVKSQQMKYQYNQVQRFNETFGVINHVNSQRNLKILQKYNYIKYLENIEGKIQGFLSKQEQDLLIQKKIGFNYNNIQNNNRSSQQFTTTLKVKQNKTQSKQSKLPANLQKSMTLRKGSLNKIIFVKKDQLKLLRLSHLLTNRNDKTERNSKKIKKNMYCLIYWQNQKINIEQIIEG